MGENLMRVGLFWLFMLHDQLPMHLYLDLTSHNLLRTNSELVVFIPNSYDIYLISALSIWKSLLFVLAECLFQTRPSLWYVNFLNYTTTSISPVLFSEGDSSSPTLHYSFQFTILHFKDLLGCWDSDIAADLYGISYQCMLYLRSLYYSPGYML